MALWRVRATVDDRPGFLAVLAASLALRSVNILAVQVHTTETGAVDDFLVDAPDAMTSDDLIAAVEKGRGRDPWVVRARAHGLVDPPTQALALAGRVARDPDALGEGLRHLLGGEFREGAGCDAITVVWQPAGEDPPGRGPARQAPAAGSPTAGSPTAGSPTGQDGAGYGFGGGTMRLPDPHGGAYRVTRRGPDFTPAEYARAQALVDLVRAAGARETARTVLLLTNGTEVVVRPAGPDDLAAVSAMHERCSPGTRQRRYLGGAASPSPAQLARLLDQTRSTTLVAEVCLADRERIVAMASLIGEGVQAEVALLVEDGWQGHGLGTALLRRIGAMAARVGYAALVARAEVGNGAALRTLGRIGQPSSVERDGGVLTVTLPLNGRKVPTVTSRGATGPGTG